MPQGLKQIQQCKLIFKSHNIFMFILFINEFQFRNRIDPMSDPYWIRILTMLTETKSHDVDWLWYWDRFWDWDSDRDWDSHEAQTNVEKETEVESVTVHYFDQNCWSRCIIWKSLSWSKFRGQLVHSEWSAAGLSWWSLCQMWRRYREALVYFIWSSN